MRPPIGRHGTDERTTSFFIALINVNLETVMIELIIIRGRID